MPYNIMRNDIKMISKEQQQFIIACVEELLPVCLEESGFDPTVKEPGHSYGEKIEEILAEKLVKKYSDKFSLPEKLKGKGKQTRKMEDLIWKPTNDLINVKLGYEKGSGQPNMVAFNRLYKNYCSDVIDSYWIFVIDVSGNDKNNLTTKTYLFNLYDYLDYVNYNYGTGQVMLKESQFFADYDSKVIFDNTKRDIVLKLKEIDNDAFISHIKLKEEQHKQRQEIFDAYL